MTTAATVAEALGYINKQPFGTLVSDPMHLGEGLNEELEESVRFL